MIAVIFEVWPGQNQAHYLALAADLRPELEQIDGFISVERFASLSEDGKLLSLSFWRDEDAVRRWRIHSRHREAQAEGRDTIFRDYRIRVVSVLRDYGLKDRIHAPKDEPLELKAKSV